MDVDILSGVKEKLERKTSYKITTVIMLLKTDFRTN